MKKALVTTTINVPRVLELYHAIGVDVEMFVAFDEKTPKAATDFCTALSTRCHPYDVDHQRSLNYACSDLIGFSNIQRRNIALLEAIKWGADFIISVDDDNSPLDSDYFSWFGRPLSFPFHGLKATSPTGWFDPGSQLINPLAPHRGFPRAKKAQAAYESITDAKVGVVAGLCLGDPDIDAITRIASSPIAHGVSELARAGVIVDPKETWTVFNSQNTSLIRELAPAFFMLPGVGRYDDILASLIMQRVMRDRDLHVHFGQPFVWQQRNSHNLVNDLKHEIYGMERIEQFATYLDRVPLPDGSVIQQLRSLWNGFDKQPNSYDLVPPKTVETALAFLDDMEKVL